jgi:metal-dependent amidase/aminoacylase/carboxypeptidase family protein
VTVTRDAGHPVTVNDPAEYAFAARTGAAAFGPDRFDPLTHPVPAAEDSGRVLERIPGRYLGLGDPATAAGNHRPHAVFDDGVLQDGANLLAALATGRLNDHPS